MYFCDMDDKMLQKALDSLRIEEINEVQKASISAHLESDEVVLHAPTGSGKTLAFLLPLIDKLDGDNKNVQTLIICPSRELVLQVEEVFRSMKTGFKSNACYGGHSMRTEIKNLSSPPAVLVATPGRLADHLRRETFETNELHHIIFDEFDKTLDLGFENEVKEIMGELPSVQSKTLVSATKAIDIPDYLKFSDPERLFFEKKESKQLEQFYVQAEDQDKLSLLYRLLCSFRNSSSLVFCNHREAVERISELLNSEGIVHDIFHGGLKQDERERALLKFRNGSHYILLCTDLAARGLDIPEIQNVVHYQLPKDEATFVHRTGRTARMHATGKSFLVLAQKEYLPKYLKESPEKLPLAPHYKLPEMPEWKTLYIGAGKKEKVNKIDIVGFMFKQAQLPKDGLGLIEVKDHCAYAAIKREYFGDLLQKIKGLKLKKQKVKFSVSR